MEVRSCCFHFTEAFHSKVALLGLLLLLGGTLLSGVESLRILVVHPLYAGSHVLTLQVVQARSQFSPINVFSPIFLLQSVTAELLKNGHSVTTVKFRDTNLPPLQTSGHPNFTLVSG